MLGIGVPLLKPFEVSCRPTVRRFIVPFLLALLCCLATPAVAFTPFTAQEVRVEGAERLEAQRILSLAGIEGQETLEVTPSRLQSLLHDLYESGYFRDVAAYRDGDTLVIEVRERPTIAEFSISGNEEIPDENLKKGLREAGLAEGRVFDRSLVDQVTQELRRQYFANGRYGVKIDTEIKELEDNRVSLAIVIDEGKVATIESINIVGNQVFDDDTLKDLLSLKESAWWRWFGSADRYSQQALSGDLESLISHYQDRGYLNFNIESTQVSLSTDKEKIYITVNVDEGERYTVASVELTGDLVVPEDELRRLVTIQGGDVFSRQAATETAKRISERLGDEGYAFAEVNPVPQIDEENKTVRLRFIVEPGRRYYVRHIEFAGNLKTRDRALRQEMRQFEGSLFRASDVARSRTRLARLPYVETVEVETVRVPGAEDLVDIRFDITERSAGAFQVGVGYSSGQGVIFNANVSHSNFLGTGNRVSIDFVNSEFSENYSASVTEPYYTMSGVSRTVSAFYRSTDALTFESSRFLSDAYGASMRFGIPLTEYDDIRLGASYRATEITLFDSSAQVYKDFVAANGDEFNEVVLETGWVRDTRNRTVFADRGYLHRALIDVAVPGADLTYYKLNYQYLQYLPFNEHLVGSWNLDLGFGRSYGDTTDLPPYEKFFAGGINTVRGYQGGTLGPKDEFGDPIGGNLQVASQFELFFPTLIPNSRNTRLSVFFDAGNVYVDEQAFDAGELRTSAGVGFQWLTPILGMMKFALATPLNEEPGDDTETFSFTFGATF